MSITGFKMKDGSVDHVDYNSLDNKPDTVFFVNFTILAEPTVVSNVEADQHFSDVLQAFNDKKLVVFTFIDKDPDGNELSRMSAIAIKKRESVNSDFYFDASIPSYLGVDGSLTNIGVYKITYIGEDSAMIYPYSIDLTNLVTFNDINTNNQQES